MHNEAQSRPEFAPAASRLAGIMALRFGWMPEQFWSATPAELNSIFAALKQAEGGDADPPSVADIARLLKDFPDGCSD
ncbi:phage tail assembly chaperone [Alterisphingorhabdus coralli]|uniref:Phage tail assembly chaperone n=1 Tax=Alterisphingorhabdus coralli TaxID=3071408 RepID=A0AA97F9C7_9SPHN|nr:phage tail assembly chaperone [Parasphingorhabdus sp. SCSIO 66989]WOE75683.1 phage tail assembly chaperone [Parasphingorhabdus sp. SCSIO 66989]